MTSVRRCFSLILFTLLPDSLPLLPHALPPLPHFVSSSDSFSASFSLLFCTVLSSSPSLPLLHSLILSSTPTFSHLPCLILSPHLPSFSSLLSFIPPSLLCISNTSCDWRVSWCIALEIWRLLFGFQNQSRSSLPLSEYYVVS